MKLEQVICPLEPGHQRGGKRLNDLSITLPRGTVQDFVWTWYSEWLFQCQVLTLFRSEGFTGFNVKPVKARFKKGTDDDKQWDGSDVFIVWPMPCFVFVSERVANCIRDHQLTGVLLRDVRGLTDVGKDGLSAGRLSDWMPESRARESGERAGIAEI
jgi:hypothetical protein